MVIARWLLMAWIPRNSFREFPCGSSPSAGHALASLCHRWSVEIWSSLQQSYEWQKHLHMSNSSHAGAKEQHRSCGESLMTYLVTYTYIIFFSTLPTAAAPHRCLTFGQKWRSIELCRSDRIIRNEESKAGTTIGWNFRVKRFTYSITKRKTTEQ